MKTIICIILLAIMASCAPLKQPVVSQRTYQKREAFTKKHGIPGNPLFDPPGGKPVIWR